jgi:hypothetical protein
MAGWEPHLLPERGHGLLTVLASPAVAASAGFAIATGLDGLPVIRANGGVITAGLVREIEGLAP